jgi:hypothetical protein
MTCTGVYYFVTAATNCIFNIEQRSTVGSTGTNITTSSMTAVVTAASTTSFSAGALTAGNWLWLTVVSISGTPGYLEVTLSVTVP